MRLFFSVLLVFSPALALGQPAHIRINQAGYQPNDSKVVIALANTNVGGRFSVRNTGNSSVSLSGDIRKADPFDWGSLFSHHYTLDLTGLRLPGRYRIELEDGTRSREFSIGEYPGYHEDLLHFMRQQRCGYNPFLDMACHLKDGRSYYGPMPDETFVGASGGWHDAGDHLSI